MSGIQWVNWDEEDIPSSDDESVDYECSDQEDDVLPERELKRAKNIELRHPITPLPEKKMKKILDDDDSDDEEVEYNLYRREKIFTPTKDGVIYIDAPYTPAPLKEKQLTALSQLPWFKKNPNHRPIVSNKLHIIDIDKENEYKIDDDYSHNNMYSSSTISSSPHVHYNDDHDINQTYDLTSFDDHIGSPIINDNFIDETISSPFIMTEDEGESMVILNRNNRKKLTPQSIEVCIFYLLHSIYFFCSNSYLLKVYRREKRKNQKES